MITLTEFLLARIAEDWAAAKAVQSDYLDIVGTGDDPWPSERAFAERFTIPRVLAECEAKRAIVEREANSRTKITYRRMMVLQDLATIYADHPDFREEWKP